MHANMHIDVYIYMCTYIYIYTYMYIFICLFIHIYRYVYIYVCICMHPYIYAKSTALLRLCSVFDSNNRAGQGEGCKIILDKSQTVIFWLLSNSERSRFADDFAMWVCCSTLQCVAACCLSHLSWTRDQHAQCMMVQNRNDRAVNLMEKKEKQARKVVLGVARTKFKGLAQVETTGTHCNTLQRLATPCNSSRVCRSRTCT